MSVADLHLCENSPASTPSGTDECECPPEYYCAEICREDFSFSTLISWQHFPRSTSSPSRCDDSSEVEIKSISETPVPEVKSAEPESLKFSLTEYPITKTFSQLNALHYLEIRHVFKFLNFLIGHLVCHEPEDPIEFLDNLLERCLKFRDSFGEPPLLFTHAHVQSLYNAFDPFERGFLTLEQYKEALNTLGLRSGITKYNEEPPLNDEGCVSDKDFAFEAEKCLVEDLKQMLRIPRLAEENRLIWQAKTARRKEREIARAMKNLEKNVPINDLKENRFCDCFGPKTNMNFICKCPRPSSLRIEPEQLYLDK